MRLAADSRTRRSSADSLLIGGTKCAHRPRQTARDSQDVTTCGRTALELLCRRAPFGAARYRAPAGRENPGATALVARSWAPTPGLPTGRALFNRSSAPVSVGRSDRHHRRDRWSFATSTKSAKHRGPGSWSILPTARFPPITPEGQKRIAARPRTGSSFSNGVYASYEDLSLYDRCITRGYPNSMLPAIYGDSYQIHPGTRLGGDPHRDDSRNAHHSAHRPCPRQQVARPGHGRRPRPLGRQHSHRGDHELQEPERVSQREPGRRCGSSNASRRRGPTRWNGR